MISFQVLLSPETMMMHILFHLIFFRTVLLTSLTFSLKEILHLPHDDKASEPVFSVIFAHFLISAQKYLLLFSLSCFFVEIMCISTEDRGQ